MDNTYDELFPTEILQGPAEVHNGPIGATGPAPSYRHHKYLVVRYPESWSFEHIAPKEHLSSGFSHVYVQDPNDLKNDSELQIIEYHNDIYQGQIGKEIYFEDHFRDENGCFYELTGRSTRDYRDNNWSKLVREHIDKKLNEMVAIKPAE